MDFSQISYEGLTRMRDAQRSAIEAGGHVPGDRAMLKELEAEIARRCYRLGCYCDGRFVREFGRWRSEEQCRELQAKAGLRDHESDGKQFVFRIEKVDQLNQ